YVTSFDIVNLLEMLVEASPHFERMEKDRIRRNLETFDPETVCRAKDDTKGFHKLIMDFRDPKVSRGRKAIKVFPWKILESAIQKAFGNCMTRLNSSTRPNRESYYDPQESITR
ncbi:unnamed protein product, partial [Fusarium langsethiae]